MRRPSTCVDDFRDHVGGRPARSARTGAISIAIFYLESAHSSRIRQRRCRPSCHARCIRAGSGGVGA